MLESDESEWHPVKAVLTPGDEVLLIGQPITYRRTRQPSWWKRLLKIPGPLVAVNNNGIWVVSEDGSWVKPR